MAISVLATAGISFDAAGLYRQTVSPPDNVFIFNDGVQNWEIIDKKGPYVARLGGILPSLADATSALQTILNSSQVKEVVFDEGNITINGTLTVPAGKVLTFENDGRFVGSGIINGGVINAGYDADIFARTLTVNPAAVSNRYFSVKWFGARGDNSVDDQPAIQKAVDTVLSTNGKLKGVYLPSGKYRIDNPVLLAKWNPTVSVEFPNGRYQFFSLDFIGESSFWEFDNSGTELVANFPPDPVTGQISGFAIGVQLGKGVRIENIRVTGQFQYAWPGEPQFFAQTYAQFLGTLPCRDSQYSPYAGIVIDPFSTTVPPDGGYLGLTSFYRGSTGAVGSTGIVIQDCFFSNFVVGFITSPNGVTLNAELVDLFRTQFRDCKACIAGCQAQEKINRVSFMACWGTTHTVLMFNQYGAGQAGYWSVDNVNLAGYNNRFINRIEGGFFNMKIDAVYAEELGRIGDFSFNQSSAITNSIFDLKHPTFTKQYFLGIASGFGKFQNCVIRYYGFNEVIEGPMPFDGNFVFDNCTLQSPPLAPTQSNAQGNRAAGSSSFNNMFGYFAFASYGVSNVITLYPDSDGDIYAYYADGRNVFELSNAVTDQVVSKWSPVHSVPSAYALIPFANKSVTRSGANNEFTFSATADELAWVKTGYVVALVSNNRIFGYGVTSVCNSTGGCLPYAITNTGGMSGTFQYTNCSGNVVVESIGAGVTLSKCSQVLPTTVTGTLTIAASSNFVTIKYIPDTVPNGNYRICVYRQFRFCSFLGDITSGSNLITNVRIDLGNLNSFVQESGQTGINVFTQNVVNPNAGDARTFFNITNWNAGTSTATANKNFNVTKQGVYFCNNGYVKDISTYGSVVNIFTSPGFGSTLLQKGGKVTVMSGGEPLTYLVTKSGYVNAASVGDTRQAEWVLDNCCTTSTTTTSI